MFRKLSFLIPLLIVAVLVLALPGTALADEGGPPDVVVVQAGDGEDGDEPPIDLSEPTSLPQIVVAALTFLIGGGSLSFFFENADWFHKFGPGNRRWIIVLADVIVVGVLAAVNEFVEPEALAKLTPYWNVIQPMVAVYFFSQVTHRINKARPIGASGAG